MNFVFAIFLASYLMWFALVVYRLLTRTLPRPCDVVILSLFFYNVPLALLASLPDIDGITEYLVFLNATASDPVIARRTLGLTALASFSVATGTWFCARFFAPAQRGWAVQCSPKLQVTAANFCIGGVIVIAAGILLFGLESFFAGYAAESTSTTNIEGTVLIFFAYEVIGICTFIWICCHKHTQRPYGKLLVIFALTTMLAITLARGKRLELLIAILPIFLLFWSTRLQQIKWRVVTLVTAIVLVSSLASLRQGELPTVASLVFNSFSEGLYAGHVTPGVIDGLDNGAIRPEFGMRFIAAAAAFIPRFVFPWKDEVIYTSLTDMTVFAPMGATTMLAEIFLQSYDFGVVTWFFLLGIIGQRIYVKSLLLPNGQIEIRAVLYLLFVCSFIPHFRDGLIPALKIPLQLLTVLLLVVLLSRTKIHKFHQWPKSARRINVAHRAPDSSLATSSSIKGDLSTNIPLGSSGNRS